MDLSPSARSPGSADATRPAKQGKHIAQHSSLLAHMRRLELFNEDKSCCFVEFGSGVGRLSEQLQEETSCRHCHFMIDREHFKNTRLRDYSMRKKIKILAKDEPCCSVLPWVSRVTDDIKNISLRDSLVQKADSTAPEFCRPVVAVSKHLCGKGFDMSVLVIIFRFNFLF